MQKFYKVKSPWGNRETKVWLKRMTYAYGGTLAIQLYCDEGPYATLTVNLETPGASDECAFVDVNNFPQAREFIEENGLGVDTGIEAQSGFCVYPLYKFDISKF